jgi:hypothetical protein
MQLHVLMMMSHRETYPAEWDGTLLLNTAPSDPVNALMTTTLQVRAADHALDFPIDMPEGVSGPLCPSSLDSH